MGKFKLFFVFIFIAGIVNLCFSQQKVIKNIKPESWKVEPLVPGETSLYGQGKYIIISASPVLQKGIMLYDNYKKKRAPFTLEFNAAEDITVYVFMYSNKSAWSKWPVSKALIKWEASIKGRKKISRYIMRYKKFPKGKVVLKYAAEDAKAGTRPFFIITSKSLYLQKKVMDHKKTELKLISVKNNAKAVKIPLFLAEKDLKNISTKLPDEKTDIFVSRDNINLYIRAVCYKNKNSKILTQFNKNISSLWQDECVEVYIQPEKKSAEYTQIIINSRGNYYIAGKALPIGKQDKLEIKTRNCDDRWEMELAVPLKMLSGSELMGINFSRTTYDSKKILKERSGWGTARYYDIDNYGNLFFAGSNEKHNQKVIEMLKKRHEEKLKLEADGYKNITESPYNYFVLWPEPKFIRKFKGKVKLNTLKIADFANAHNTAEFLKKELKKQYDFTFNASGGHALILSRADNPRIQRILKKHKIQDKLKGKKPDSFIITIGDDGILIAGNNDRGIYYGVRAFLKIVDYSTGIGESPCAGFMDIADWPDQKLRFLFWRFESITREAKPDLDMVKRYLSTLAGARYNGIVFMMRDGIKYKSHPELARKGAISTDEFKELVKYCRENYLEPVPAMNTPGHGNWIVRRHKELSESNISTICTRNPKSLKLIFDIAQELIDLCGGVGKVRYFHVGRDEIRWDNNDRNNKWIKDECSLCKGTPRKDLLLEYIKKEHDFFKKRGIRMIMWSDMFDRKRNGEHYQTYKILKDLPRDIILSPWSSLGYPMLAEYKKMGFDVIKGATGYKVLSEFDNISEGHMFAIFSRNQWMTFDVVKLSSHNYYNHLSAYLYGQNAWTNDRTMKVRNKDEWSNLKTTVQKRGEKKKLESLMKYGNAMTYFQNKKRFPAETQRFKIINISDYCNKDRADCFGAGNMFDLNGLKNGRQDIAGIPMEIDKKIIVLPSGSVKDIKIAEKASSILFLYAAYLDPAKENAFKKRIRYKPEFQIVNKRSPIAYYIIKYADGSSEKVTMNYGFNVGALRPPLHSRYTYDIRYVLRAAPESQDWPEVQECRDCSPGAPAAYQYEWVNPHPEKEITSIDFISMNTEVIPALIALTVREAE